MVSFGGVYGHERIVRNLQSAVIAGRAPHAAIFSGPAGLGKKLLAGCLAKALVCENREEGRADACGGCVSCKTFESGNHPDVFTVRATKTKAIGVGDVREQIVNSMAVRPYRSSYKIYIVERADTMTAAAQNALLKTIEEPAGYGVFLLLCETFGALLPTVRSRCAPFKLKPVADALVRRALTEKAGLSAGDAARLAPHAAGNIGRALALAVDDAFMAMRAQVLSMAAALAAEPPEAALTRAKEMEGFKDRISEALDILHLWYRDLAVEKATGRRDLLTQKDMLGDIEACAGPLTLGRVLENCDAVALAKKQLAHYGHFQLVMETLLLTLRES